MKNSLAGSILPLAFMSIALLLGACGSPEKLAQKTLADLGYDSTSAEEFLQAAADGNNEAIRLFIEYGMNVDSLGMTGQTALMKATQSNQLTTVKGLIDLGADPNTTNPEGRSALHLASEAGFTDATRLLLARSANIELKDREGWSALTLAAFNGHPRTVELLATRSEKNELDEALLVASFRGQTETIHTLLANGAYSNSRSPANQTPLMIAAQNGHYESVEALILAGANPYAMDNEGRIAADLANENGHTTISELLLGTNRMMASDEAEGKVLNQPQSIDGAVLDSKTTGRSEEKAPIGGFALESFEEEPLPVMFKGIDDDQAQVRVLSSDNNDPVAVTRGAMIDGTDYRVVDYEQQFISGKEGYLNATDTSTEEAMIDASQITIENVETGARHLLVKDIAGHSSDTYAVLSTPDNSARYIVRAKDRFQTQDSVNGNGEFEVLDIRPTQVIVQDLNTFDVYTIARDGLVAMNGEPAE